MTVEELIEILREMPPTSRVEIDTGEMFLEPIGAAYELAVTTIRCGQDTIPEEQ